MRNLIFGLCLVISTVAFAADTKPSEASIKELLQLSGSTKMVEMTKGQLAAMQNGALQQSLQGHPLTPGVRKILEASSAKASVVLNDGLKWEAVEPVFVDVYQSTMTQEEVDGIVAFYKTPAGKAMVEKLPALMQMSGQKLQVQLGPIMEKLKSLQQETSLQLQAEFAKQN